MRAATIGELHSHDTVAVPEKVADARALCEVDAARDACALQEDEVERLSADREVVADRAWILRRGLAGLRSTVGVVELPRERRASEREDGVENAEPLEHAHHSGSAKEMCRARRAWKPRTVEQEHGNTGVTEQRSQRRASDARPDDDHVIAVTHGPSLLSGV